MATKITSRVIADNAVTDAKLHSDFTATTQSASDNTTNVATTAYVTTAIANLSDSAPSTLNTLNELAAALGDDANYATTTTNAIAAKAPLANPTLTGSLNVVPTAATGLTYGVDGTNSYINFKANSVGDSVQLYAGQNDASLPAGGYFSIGTKNSSGTLIGRMRIDSTGKVGIGTQSPIRLLDIKDTGTGDPGIRMESQSYSMDVITLRNGDGRVGFGGDAITVLQSGDIGIGAIPSGEAAAAHAVRLGDQVCISEYDDGSNPEQFNLFQNSNSAEKYIETGTASAIQQRAGGLIFKNAGSGSAGSAISFSERMRIHANGKVGFSANGMGDVNTIPRDFAFFTEGSTNGVEIRSNDQRLMMLGAGGSGGTASDDGYLTMSSQGTAKLWLSANGSSVFNGGAVGINRTPSVTNSKLEVGGADNVPLIVAEASGFYGGIGANGSTGKGRGLQIFAGQNIIATFNNQTNVAYTSDGLFASNARPNQINCTGSGKMVFGYMDSGSGLYSAAMGMEFDEINGLAQTQWVDGWVMKATSSGTKTLRIETDGDMYNVNGTYTSGSDRRIKKEISDASSQWDDVKAVRVRKFKLGATPEGSPHDHFHIGVIAQEIEEAGMNGLIKEMTPDDGHIRFNPDLAGDKIKTVKYSILQMKAFKALQEAMEKIETLEAKVAALEAE